jgi:hypothetical protein
MVNHFRPWYGESKAALLRASFLRQATNKSMRPEVSDLRPPLCHRSKPLGIFAEWTGCSRNFLDLTRRKQG